MTRCYRDGANGKLGWGTEACPGIRALRGLSFNVGVELGQLGFVALVLAIGMSFRVLEFRWPRWVQALPGYTVGALGAFWTIQRVALLIAALR